MPNLHRPFLVSHSAGALDSNAQQQQSNVSYTLTRRSYLWFRNSSKVFATRNKQLIIGWHLIISQWHFSIIAKARLPHILVCSVYVYTYTLRWQWRRRRSDQDAVDDNNLGISRLGQSQWIWFPNVSAAAGRRMKDACQRSVGPARTSSSLNHIQQIYIFVRAAFRLLFCPPSSYFLPVSASSVRMQTGQSFFRSSKHLGVCNRKWLLSGAGLTRDFTIPKSQTNFSKSE